MQQTQNGGVSGFFRRSQQHKVQPLSADSAPSQQVEVRPKRVLRIQHINARPRDARFEKEMQMQMGYRSQGLHAGSGSGGPLSMPRKKRTREASSLTNAQVSTPLPHALDLNTGGDMAHREISASGSKATFTSPSNVHVAMHTPMPGSTCQDPDTHSAAGLQSQGKGESSDEKQSPGGEADTAGTSVDGPNTSIPLTTSPRTGQSATFTEAISQSTSPRTEPQPDISTQAISQKTSPRAEQLPAMTSPRRKVEIGKNTPSTVLFFIHGVGGSSDVWRAQMRHFAAEGYEIVAPDLIGHGMSCTPKNSKAYHFLECAADIEEIFDKYCKKRNVVIGHSYGCSFAVVLARRRSRRVSKLVLISGGAPTPLAPQPGVFSLPTCLLTCCRPCLNCTFHRSAFHKSRRPVVDTEVDRAEAFSIPTYVLQYTMNGQDWPDGDELYHQWLLCPTLLLYGAQDRLVKLKEEQHMEEVIFRSRLEVIPEASHMVMIEAPDVVNRLLLDFLLEDSSLPTQSNSPQPPSQPPPPPQQQPPPPPQQPQQPPPPHPLDRSVSRMSIRSTKSHKAMPGHLI